MTSKEAIEFIEKTLGKMTFHKELGAIKKDLEVLEIIKENPELVWWCVCYETAEEMIIDRKGFMLNYSMNEIIEQFNKVKEWLNEK